MLVRCDIVELMEYVVLSQRNPGQHDVFVAKHDYTPKAGTKFLGNTQHHYPKKNWSSLMLFNCGSPGSKKLTPEIVNTESGAYLHQMEWADSVGELHKDWNHLVGEYEENPDAKIVHYTLGTPCFSGYENQEYSAEWFQEQEMMLHAD